MKFRRKVLGKHMKFRRRVLGSLSLVVSGYCYGAVDSTQWFYGNGVCAGGYKYDIYKSCFDYTKPSPVIVEDPSCGYEEQTQDQFCRRADFGPLAPIPASELGVSPATGVAVPGTIMRLYKKMSISRMNQKLTAENMQAYCETDVKADPYYFTGKVHDGANKDVYLVPDETAPSMVIEDSGESRVCAERDLFKKCVSWHHTRSASCMIRLVKMQYPKGVCSQQVVQGKMKSCKVGDEYPVTARQECGYLKQDVTTYPFTSDSKIAQMGTGNIRCTTHDEMPDQTPAQLAAKVSKLLKNIDFSSGTEYDAIVKERSVAMLRNILNTRSSDLSEEQILWVFNLPSDFRFLEADKAAAFKADDILVKVGGKFPLTPGSSTNYVYEVKVSLPKYADYASVCLDTTVNCAKPEADWFFGNLSQHAGTRYIYSAYVPQKPSVFTVKGMAGRNLKVKQFQAGVNESTLLEPDASEAGSGKIAFGTNCLGNDKVNVYNVSTGALDKTINGGCKLTTDGNYFFQHAGTALKKYSAKDGSLIKSYDLPSGYYGLVMKGSEALAFNGSSLYNPEFDLTVKLEGSPSLVPEDIEINGNIIAAAVAKHEVQFWSFPSGNKTFTITHEVEGFSPPVYDKVKVKDQRIFVKSYTDSFVRVYDLSGQFLRNIEVGEGHDSDYYSESGKKIISTNGKIRVIDVETGAVEKEVNFEEYTTYRPLASNEDMSLVYIHTYKKIPGGNNNNPFQGPINVAEAAEIWNLKTGQRVRTISLPEGMRFLGFLN